MMTKYRAIPEGFMTVGELAKKMNVTVRTLQYYDKEGVLSPSAESEGGRRLYTDKDLVLLHQILSLKSLGFFSQGYKRGVLISLKHLMMLPMLLQSKQILFVKILNNLRIL